MAGIRALLLISLILWSALSTFAARPEPAQLFHGLPAKTPHKGVEAEKYEEEVEAAASCDGVGEEECLMRRTLNAHVDYIYTQEHKP